LQAGGRRFDPGTLHSHLQGFLWTIVSRDTQRALPRGLCLSCGVRALFTVQPAAGHLHPLVPVANALSDAGHDVVVCSARSFRSEVEAFGLPFIDAGLDWLISDQSTWEAFPPMPAPGPEFPAWVVLTLADITTQRMVPDLLAVARDWKPDLVIREGMEYGGCVAAEALGIPHASVAGNAYAAVDSPEINYLTGNRWMVAEPLARHRKQFGLPPDPEVEMPFRYLHLCFTPPSWDGSSATRPRNAHFLRHISTVARGAQLPDWVEGLPDRPTVLASLGTVFNKTPGVLEAIVDALAEEPINVIVAIGRDRDPSSLGPQPDHVRLEAYVPQPLVLAHCDAFVTHGGFNSVKEALSSGVPMVVIPISADQPYSAERCGDLGVALTLGADARTPDAIRNAVRRVLADPSYRANAHAFQQEMMALPGPDEMVELLESLFR
jgi:MGT family glycosyltransferase